jgi:hypothetical protein
MFPQTVQVQCVWAKNSSTSERLNSPTIFPFAITGRRLMR